METIGFVIAVVALQLALILYMWGFVSIAIRKKAAGEEHSDTGGAARFANPVLAIAWIALTISLVSRSVVTGHVPFTDMYEFSASFCWGVLMATLFFQWRSRYAIVGAGGAVIAFALLVYAFALPSSHAPLAPALQNTVLLPLHVSCAIIAYGMFAVGFRPPYFF